MSDPSIEPGPGDAGGDESGVAETGADDLAQDPGADERGSGARDDDMASGHIGEPGGPAWARGS